MRARLYALCVAGLVALPGCAVSGIQDPSASIAAPGVAHLQLAIPLDVKLGEVAYEISGNDIAPIDGIMVASPASDSLGAVVRLPSGHGYMLHVSTVAGPDFMLCQSTLLFDVNKDEISEIPVLLKCGDVPLGGSSSADADAAMNTFDLDAGVHSKDAGNQAHDASSDGATAHGGGALDMQLGGMAHDAGKSTANGGADAGAFTQASPDSCSDCRLFVCASLADPKRVASCYLAWGAANEVLPCDSASDCPANVCAQACATNP